MIFPADKDKGFKLIVSLLVCVARHAQITQNNKFAICFLDLKGNMKDEVDFCLQINAKGLKWILSFQVCEWQSLPKLPKVTSLLCLCHKKRVDFLHAYKPESSLQIDTLILMGMIKHS